MKMPSLLRCSQSLIFSSRFFCLGVGGAQKAMRPGPLGGGGWDVFLGGGGCAPLPTLVPEPRLLGRGRRSPEREGGNGTSRLGIPTRKVPRWLG